MGPGKRFWRFRLPFQLVPAALSAPGRKVPKVPVRVPLHRQNEERILSVAGRSNIDWGITLEALIVFPGAGITCKAWVAAVDPYDN